MEFTHKYSDIIVDRRGSLPHSNMTTTDVIDEVRPYTNYHITTVDLRTTREKLRSTAVKSGINNYIVIPNTWNRDININTRKSNILGKSGTIIVDTEVLNIPVSTDYSYFGVTMYHIGDIIRFEDIYTCLPVCNIEIGRHYINEYIMKCAGGVYLEYHDRPHFHMPRDRRAKGYIILGKFVEDNIHLAAFNIPYGCALYTPNNVIHNDCFLTGKYIVVYSKTEDYSNVLLKNKMDEPIRVRIIK